MLKIIKRDGRKVDFSDDKMKSAIWRAMERTEKGIDSQLTTRIVDLFKSKHSGEVEVDQIQDFIEKELMKSSRKDAASEFIKKRHERDVARNAKTKNIFMGIIQAENNEITRENANMNADTPAGMMMKFASETTKPFVDNYLISDEAKDAVRNNYIHIHDKDYYPTKSLTCLSGDTKIKIKDKRGVISQVTINFFDDFFKEKPSQEPELVTLYEPYFILGRNGWTNLNSISRRTVSAKDNYYCLLTDKGSLKVTGTHRIPVITPNGDEVLKQVDDIKVGDKLLSIDSFNTNNDHYLDLSAAFSDDSDIIVTNINKLRKWLNYKYDFVLDEPPYLSIRYYRSLEKKYSIPGDVKVDLCISNGSRVIPMILPVTPEVADLFGALTWGYFDETVGNNLFLFEDEKSINIFKEALAKTKIFGDDYKQEHIRFSNKTAYYCSFDFMPVINYFSSLIKDSIPGFIKRSDTIKKHFILFQVDNNFKTAYLDKSVAFEMINLLTEVGIEKVFIEVEKNKARLGINQQDSKFLLEDILKKEFSVDYSADPFESTTYTTTEIFNKSLLTKENDVVYDLETSEHWFVANDFVVHNCLQHPLDKILEKGFKAGHGEARPAKRIETASILACISMESIQNEMHGGQAIPAIDFYMAPYVRMTYIEELEDAFSLLGLELTDEIKNEKFKDYVYKDIKEIKDPLQKAKQKAMNSTIRRVHQSMESFIHNLNTIHSRGGNQVVFSSVNYGTDTSAEGRCVMRELLLTTERGVGNGSTAIFPIQIWKLKKGVSYLPGDPNYDLYKLACRVTAKRFFPNFLNLDASFNQDPLWKEDDPKRYLHEVATMGCRTRVYDNKYGPRTSVGRGNLSFTTINLPKLAIDTAIEDGYLYNAGSESSPKYVFDETKNTPELQKARVERFMAKLKEMVKVATKQLSDRYDFQKTALAKQFPLLMSGMWIGSENLNPNDTIESVLNQGTLVCGFIGLAEALVALTGKHHGESEESQKIGLEAVKLIYDDCKYWGNIYDHNMACFATPAESLSGKFTKIDRKLYGEIPGVTDREYYTNSNHVPVYYNISAAKKFEIEGPYHKITPAGHISYVEIDGDLTNNPEAIMDIVDLMVKNDIGYGSINHTQARCPICNFETSEKGITECPHCHTPLDVLQRITGYLVGTTDRWNYAKLSELRDRVQHDV